MKRILSLLLITVILLGVIPAFAADPVPVASITLSQDSACIPYKKTIMVKATIEPRNASVKTLAWSSSDERVATVKSGQIVGVGTGTAIITAAATDGSGVTASMEITVVTPVTKIIPEHHNLILAPDIVWPLYWTVEPETADNPVIAWTSSNGKVATVNENGVIYARTAGTTTITGTATDGSGTKVAVNVQVKPHDIVILKPGDYDVDFETEETNVAITITNAGKTSSKNTDRRFRTKNGTVISPEDMVIRPVKAGSDVISIVYLEKAKPIKTENHSVFVSPAAVGESTRLNGDGSPAPVRFLNLLWGANYPQVKTQLDNSGRGLKTLSQRNEYLRAILADPVLFGNVPAFSAAVNFTYTPGDRMYEVRNSLFKGDLYFDTEIPVEVILKAVKTVYSLGEPEQNGDEYSWTQGHIRIVLTKKSRFTILELIWDGGEDESAAEEETAAEETEAKDSGTDSEEEDDEDWDF